MKYFMFVASLLALLLSACGSPSAAKYDPTQVQASVVAAVSTTLGMTQAAIPSITPALLPTETPLPSPTVALLATLPPFTGLSTAVNPTATPQGGGGSCIHPLDTGQAGPGHATLIKNETDGPVGISLNLYTPNAFGQCGSISYGTISKNGSVLASLPAGYWYAYAWARSKDNSFTTSLSFFVQPAQFLKLELCVRNGKMVYKQTC
jgi:hypothetical protein